MTGRDDILSSIRNRRVKTAPRPALYRPPAVPDLVTVFVERVRFANAEVRLLSCDADVPVAIAELLRARNLPAVLHVPPGAASNFAWDMAPGLSLEASPPGSEDAALAIAPLAIAETGTLAYPAVADAPASWHFRAGFEIAIVRVENILPHMETAVARLKERGDLGSTINFVTGPSRTGDIEQTLEIGAHGPKALAILVINA